MKHTSYRPGFRASRLLSLALALMVAGACKRKDPVSLVKSEADLRAINAVEPAYQATVYRPLPAPTVAPLTAAELIAKAEPLGFLSIGDAATTTVQLLNGETVLLIDTGSGMTPVASVFGDDVFDWSAIATGQIAGDSMEVKDTNVFMRYVPGTTPLKADVDQVYMVYGGTDPLHPDLIALTSHAITGSGMLRRSGNRFLDGDHQPAFAFEPIEGATNAWRLHGKFYNGFLCEGSAIWQDPADAATLHSATREYDELRVYTWHAKGDLMSLVSADGDKGAPAAYAVSNCPGTTPDDVRATISGLQYDPHTVMGVKGAAKTFDPHGSYKIGEMVRVDDSSFVYMMGVTRSVFVGSGGIGDPGHSVDVTDHYFLNEQRTFGEDGGKPYTRIFKWASNAFTEVARTPAFMLLLAKEVQDLSRRRIAASAQIAAEQTENIDRLKLVDKRAAQMDTLGKMTAVVVAGLTFELCFKAMKARVAAPLGIKLGTVGKYEIKSLADAANFGVIQQRLLSTVYLTVIQGISNSATTVVNKIDQGQWANAGIAGATATGVGGGVLLLRSLFQAGPLKGATVLASGVLMRYRKMSNEDALGYDNGDQLHRNLNLAAGAATALLQTLSDLTLNSAGVNKAIGGLGVMVSEMISGRGTPDMVVGQLVETAINLLAKDPRVRAFAPIVNTLVQYGTFGISVSSTSERLDQALALVYQQAARRDALLWLLKTAPEQMPTSAQEKTFVLATVVDPYEILRQHYVGKSAEKP